MSHLSEQILQTVEALPKSRLYAGLWAVMPDLRTTYQKNRFLVLCYPVLLQLGERDRCFLKRDRRLKERAPRSGSLQDRQ